MTSGEWRVARVDESGEQGYEGRFPSSPLHRSASLQGLETQIPLACRRRLRYVETTVEHELHGMTEETPDHNRSYEIFITGRRLRAGGGFSSTRHSPLATRHSPLKNEAPSMAIGQGVIRGHFITLRRFLLTFWRDVRNGHGLKRRGGGHLLVDFFRKPGAGHETTVQQDSRPTGSSRSSIPTSGCRSTSGSASCRCSSTTPRTATSAAPRATSARRSARPSASG